MSVETDLYNVLKLVCPRTFPDFAAVSTARPYVTWQQIGGTSLRFVDNTPFSKRESLMQVNVWSNTRLEAMTLARQIEDALCAATAFVAEPQGEPVSDFDADIPVYGCRQDFSIFATR